MGQSSLVVMQTSNPLLNLSLAQQQMLVAETVVLQGPQGPAGATTVAAQDVFTPANGQTVFQLSQVPKALSINASVNGQTIYLGIHFTVSGSVVTLLSGLGYALSSTDTVQFSYFT